MSKRNTSKKPKTALNTRKESKTFLENKWFAIGFIVLISAVVYYNSLNTPFVLDDSAKIVKNPDIKQLSNIKTKLIYPYNKRHYNSSRNDPSRPLVYLTFTLNYHFGKLNTFGYHLFNVLMHAFNAVLIFFLVKKIIVYTYRKDSVIFPLFVALFFAVHTINTSVVTYIFSRSDILVTFFYILSLLFFIKTFEKNNKLYIFSLLFFILSLFSKQIAITLPAIVLIFDYIFLSDFKIEKVTKKKYYHTFFWIILLFYLLFRYFYFGGIGDLEARLPWEMKDYIVIQPYVILKYLQLLLIPSGLSIDHSITSLSIYNLRIILSVSLITVISIMIYRTYKKKTDISKIVLFCALWFFVTLSPTSSFFPTTSALVENRLYLSGLGFYLAIVFIYFLIFFERKHSWVLYGLMGIHLFLLGTATVKRNQVYQNPVYLWQDVISKYPNNHRALNNLGLWYFRHNEYKKAIEEYNKALKADPNNADSHYNLGLLYKKFNKYNKAIEEYNKAIEIDPDFVEAYNNLGVVYYCKKNYSRAAEQYQKALEINPKNVNAYNNLGILYCEQKEYAKAIQKFQKALEINPDDTNAHYNLGVLYKSQKEYAKAIQKFQKALEANPNYADARNNLGILYCGQKEYAKAVHEFQKILEVNPDNVDAHNNLGVLYYSQKDYKKALQEFEYLLKLNSDDENIRAKIKMVKELIE